MNTTQWYYMDRGGQRRGPLAAGELVAAHRTGNLLDDGLVWREDRGDWRVFDDVRDELGAAPRKRRSSGLLTIVLVAMFGMLLVVAMLAAIAIPAYQDYVIRSQVSEAGLLAEGPKQAVANFHANRGGFPSDNAAAGLPDAGSIHTQYITSVAVVNGTILVTYGNKANRLIAGRVLAFAPHDAGTSVNFTCDSQAGTTVDMKFRPIVCRR